jgi:hypothetical protein
MDDFLQAFKKYLSLSFKSGLVLVPICLIYQKDLFLEKLGQIFYEGLSAVLSLGLVFFLFIFIIKITGSIFGGIFR